MNGNPADLRSDLGEIARAQRKALGMSQEDVAYKLKIEQTDLSKIERGAKRPSLDLALRLAAVLQLPTEAFAAGGRPLTGADDP